MNAKQQKKCRACSERFLPTQFAQVVCSPRCAITYTQQAKQRKEKKAHAKAKREFRLSDKSLQKKLTQALVNKFVRLRDAGKPCISCGTHEGQMQAGHYFSVGSSEHLRYAVKNIHLQCSTCNHHLSANLINYRIGLVERYGVEFVEALEADKAPRKFNNEEVILIGQFYKSRCKGEV